MARKDLSRTVIEGGRYYRNSWERRASHGVERARTRGWLAHVLDDVEVAEARPPRPRPRVPKDFHDKLAPARRWLDAQVGRPWDKVYGELRARFDRRTIAGQHVVFDHLLAWVWRGDVSAHVWSFSKYHFVVDAHGILRRGRYAGRSYRKLQREVAAWADGRRLARAPDGWWWFRVGPLGPACDDDDRPCTRHDHDEHAGARYHASGWVRVSPVSARQLRYFERLPPELQRPLVLAYPPPAAPLPSRVPPRG